MNYYLALLLIAVLFGIIIKNLLGKPRKENNSNYRAIFILIIGFVGLIWSMFLNPAIALFSFGFVPFISLFFFISGLVRLIKIWRMQGGIIKK